MGTSERRRHGDGESLSIGSKYYLMAFLAFGLVEASHLLRSVDSEVFIYCHKMLVLVRWGMGRQGMGLSKGPKFSPR